MSKTPGSAAASGPAADLPYQTVIVHSLIPSPEALDSRTIKVLVVDAGGCRGPSLASALRSQGDSLISLAGTDEEALLLLEQQAFDCVVSASAATGLDGLDLLRKIRKRKPEVPVVLVIAHPSLESAAHAVEWGAFRYLMEPVEPEPLAEAVRLAARACQVSRLRYTAYEYLRRIGFPGNQQPGAAAHFEGALSQVWMAFQPIVLWPERRVVGYEALVRSRDPVLSRPRALLEAAEGLGRLHELGQVIRNAVAEVASTAAGQVDFFVNLHAQDLLDVSLYSASSPLSVVASRVVLEITERVSLDLIDGVRERVASLRRLGYRIALDDLGAGYSGLSSLAQLEPDFIKLDMALTRDVHREPTRRALVESLAGVCRQMNLSMVAEGVESEAERDELASAGCGLFQGYLFGLPLPGLLEPAGCQSGRLPSDQTLRTS